MHSTHIRRHIQLLSLQSHAFEMFCRISNSCGCIETRCYRLEPIKRKIPQRVIVCGDFNLAHNRESHLRERCYLMRFKLNIIGITSTIRIMWWYCSRTNRAYYWKCVDCFLFLFLSLSIWLVQSRRESHRRRRAQNDFSTHSCHAVWKAYGTTTRSSLSPLCVCMRIVAVALCFVFIGLGKWVFV